MKLSNQELIYILEGLSIFRDDLKDEGDIDIPNTKAYYEVWNLMDKVRVELDKI